MEKLDLRSRYGAWGIVLGASEGLGKGMAMRIAEYGMNVVLVGHHYDDLCAVEKEIKEKYNRETKVIVSDFSQDDASEGIFSEISGLDIGFMSYIACLHKFGKVQDTPWEDHKRMLNVNINTFLSCFYYFLGVFAKQDRGLIINISSLTAITSSPYNGQYGAGKAYIKKMTEAAACEMRKTGVDVMCATLGSTRTPSFLANIPGGPNGERAIRNAMSIEDTLDDIFSNIGKVRSLVVGDEARRAAKRWETERTYDQASEEMGAYYEN